MSQSVRRAARIVDELAARPRTVADLAADFDLHRSTMFRELKALEEIGYARRRPDGTYTLGMKFVTLGQEVLAQIDVRDAAAEPARRLHQVTGNTVHVAALVGDDILYVDKVEDEAGVRMYSRVGAPARAHCSGVGKVILAGLRGRNRQALLAKVSWEKYTENTITDRHALEAQLEVIAAQGWAADDGEFEDFVNCLAVPITSSAGVVGALSVTAIRMVKNLEDLREYLPLMQRVAAEVGRELG
ncbi:MAG TPA: IclR family transcriptional regulator [Beutenbergiaceae bacterium]|nr:IclR family transcriptional regulator [Beutenbergiaceae bacterium]